MNESTRNITDDGSSASDRRDRRGMTAGKPSSSTSVFGPMLFLITLAVVALSAIFTMYRQRQARIDKAVNEAKQVSINKMAKALEVQAQYARSITLVDRGSCPPGTEEKQVSLKGKFQCLLPCPVGFESVSYTSPDDKESDNITWFCRATCPDGKNVSGNNTVCKRDAIRRIQGDTQYGTGPNVVLCDKDSSPGGNYNGTRAKKKGGPEDRCFHHYRNYTQWEDNTVVGCGAGYERLPITDKPIAPFRPDRDHDNWEGKPIEGTPKAYKPGWRCVRECPINMRAVGPLHLGICAEDCPANTKNVFNLKAEYCLKDAFVQQVVSPNDPIDAPLMVL